MCGFNGSEQSARPANGRSIGAWHGLTALRNLVAAGLATANPPPGAAGGGPRWTPRAGSPLLWVPNVLTVLRMVLAPVFVVLVLRTNGRDDWPLGIVFGLTALTDLFDGLLARIWRAESAFGKIADPLADKLLMAAVIVGLVIVGRLPWLALVLPFARHIALWAVRFWRPRQGMLAPHWTGKLSAWMLYTALGVIIVSAKSAEWSLWVFWVGVAIAFADIARHLTKSKLRMTRRR